MTIFEFIEISRELMKRIENSGIRISDVDHVDMYKDYLKMMGRKDKKTYVVTVLAERYSISVRTVYNVIKRFEKECKRDAV